MKPSPSASTSRIIFRSSSSVAVCPRLFIMDPSSEDEILPSPLTSSFLKICSSSAIWALPFRDGERDGNELALIAVDSTEAPAEEADFFLRRQRDLKFMIKTNRKAEINGTIRSVVEKSRREMEG
ncbi:hypothetical protein F2P56_030692 [Juglans regia]|uniref:Uncharacterized protein n=1 Tax=Juglans regia TaxID=51240 RepID=A0A833TQ77_JUGRE|nr:hypothetical protein F2P56_030692 [Juglans regia]